MDGRDIDIVILARGLVKRFGDLEAVKGINFSVHRGECFGLLGPNGAGKTSIVKMIYGFSPVSSGSLEVFGEDIMSRSRSIKSRIGVVPQVEPVLYLWAMGFGLGVYVTGINGMSYINFLAPALIASSAMFSTTYEMTYGSFTRMGCQKTFHGMVATPVSMDDVVMGEILYGTFKGVLYGMVFFLVVAMFGLVKSPWALLVPLPLALMVLVFSVLSLIWTSIAPNYDSFGYFFTLIISPMFLFAGVFFPVEDLSGGIRLLAWLTPLYHAVEVNRPMVLGGVAGDVLPHLAWLAAVAALTVRIPLAMVKNRLIQ